MHFYFIEKTCFENIAAYPNSFLVKQPAPLAVTIINLLLQVQFFHDQSSVLSIYETCQDQVAKVANQNHLISFKGLASFQDQTSADLCCASKQL